MELVPPQRLSTATTPPKAEASLIALDAVLFVKILGDILLLLVQEAGQGISRRRKGRSARLMASGLQHSTPENEPALRLLDRGRCNAADYVRQRSLVCEVGKRLAECSEVRDRTQLRLGLSHRQLPPQQCTILSLCSRDPLVALRVSITSCACRAMNA